MADDGVWRRGGSGSRRGGRGRGGGGGGGRRGFRRRGGGHPLSRDDEDGDFIMEERESVRYKPYGRAHMDNPGGGSSERSTSNRPSVFSRIGGNKTGGGGGGGGGSRPSHERSSWHKVTIIRGGSQSREWLMRTLRESISEAFKAVQTHQLGDKVMFYVDDYRAADQLKTLESIKSKDGQLRIVVKPSDAPRGSHEEGSEERPDTSRRGGRPRGQYTGSSRRSEEDMSGDVVMMEGSNEVIQAVLADRYQSSSYALNLSNMFNEKRFRDNQIRASMYDWKFVTTILTLIGELCPDLQELNLSSNRIQRLETYKDLPMKCAKLTSLDLSSNDIRDITELEHVKGMATVTSLRLQDNPVAKNSHDIGALCSSVRKYFPNLQFLDGQSLPSPVKFDLPVNANALPAYVKNYLPNDHVKELVVKFIEQYYTLYDGTSREKLLEAYGEEALFSLCVVLPVNQRDSQLQKYIGKSRNLFKVKEEGRRQSSLKHGRIDIVQLIRDLPQTKHHTDLFEVDIVRASDSEIYFIVYGVFSEEGDHKEILVRSFTRSFILFQVGGSVVIMNDMLSISSATSKTIQYIQDVLRSSPSSLGSSTFPPAGPSAASITGPSAASIPAAMPITGPGLAAPSISTAVQEEAIRKLAEATKMNFTYCQRCLADANWDLSVALNLFQSLRVQGQIPQEAFL